MHFGDAVVRQHEAGPTVRGGHGHQLGRPQLRSIEQPVLLRQIGNAVDTWKRTPIDAEESCPLSCPATQVELDTSDEIGCRARVRPLLPHGRHLLRGSAPCSPLMKGSSGSKANVAASLNSKHFEKPANHTKSLSCGLIFR